MSFRVDFVCLVPVMVSYALAASTTSTLAVSSSSTNLGQPVSLTASVSPSTATGKFTIYDGAVILGVTSVASGSASFTTNQLNSGAHFLTARYDGDSTNTSSISGAVTLTVQATAALTFLALPQIEPYSLSGGITADINGDGKTDLLVIGDDSILIFIGQGNGSFTAGSTISLAQTAVAVAVADVNGDGIPDLAVALSTPSVQILLGNGDGTFVTASSIGSPAGIMNGLQIADFNSDGKADILFFLANCGGISIAPGNGDGTFAAATPVSIPPAVDCSGVIAADFHGDGKVDLIVPSYPGYAFYAGNGNGTFGTASIYASPALNWPATAVDLNGDGKLDLVWNDGSHIQSTLGNGNGTFQGLLTEPSAGQGLAIADVNGDGRPDAITATNIYYSNGDGTFQSAFVYAAGGSASAQTFLNVADLNNNGQIDIVAGGSFVYLGTDSSSLALTASANSAALGQTVTLTATVTPSTATGEITFLDTGTTIGTVSLVSGVATLRMPTNATGLKLLSATYPGDADTQTGVSPLVTVTVTGAASTVALSTNVSSVTYGQPVTLTAIVSPASATGHVTFSDSGLVIGGGPLSSGTAVLSTAALGTGSHSLTAQYDGGPTFSPSHSATRNVVVNSLPASAAITGPQLTDSNLPIQLASADFNHDGFPDLAVANSNSSVSVYLATGAGTFAAPVLYNVGGPPLALSLLDVNNDGFPDILAPTLTGLNVLLGNGDGSFRPGPANTFAFPSNSGIYGNNYIQYPWAPADFNSDGRVDLAVLNQATSSFLILFGNGDGSFQAPVAFGVTGQAGELFTADFNRDGFADIILTVALNGTSGELLVFPGNGDGTFRPAVATSGPSGIGTSDAAIGDFNEDGIADVAVLLPYGYGLTIYLGNGDGSFRTGATYPESSGHLYTADVNGDGHLDLISGWDNSLSLGNGDGTFTLGSFNNYLFVGSPLVTGNFGQTGRVSFGVIAGSGINIYFGGSTSTLSLSASPSPGVLGDPVTLEVTVTPSDSIGTVTFYSKNGLNLLGSAAVINGVASLTISSLPANFQSFYVNYSGSTSTAPANAYFEGYMVIGLPAVTSLSTSTTQGSLGALTTLYATLSPAAATGPVTFLNGSTILGTGLLAGGQAALSTSVLPSGTNKIKAVYAGDSTYEAGAASTPTSVRITAKQGNGFRSLPLPAAFPPTVALAVSDLNGDGIPDLLGANFSSNGLLNATVLLGRGDGSFSAGSSIPLEATPPAVYPQAFALVDFNGDGKLDLVAPYNYYMGLYLGNGDGTFNPQPQEIPVLSPTAVVATDFNGDGLPDLALIDQSGLLYILLGTGGGGYEFLQSLPAFSFTYSSASLAVGDFDGDGKADLAISGYATNGAGILLGNGDGTFRTPLIANAGAIPGEMIIEDFNRDGIEDLAILTGSPANSFVILLGNGTGAFQAPMSIPCITGATQIGTGDFNGDGIPDIVTTSAETAEVFWGNGDGTFQAPVSYGDTGSSAIVADLNGDGVADLPGLLGIPSDSVTLTSTTPTPTIDQTITLTATVSPSNAIGTVTFYDGATVLGNAAIVNGVATLTVTLPATGLQNVLAKYQGSSTYSYTASSPLSEVVTATAGGTFVNAVNYSAGTTPSNIVAGDFNHDGLVDVAVASNSTTVISVLWGAGNGTFSAPLSVNVPGIPVSLAMADVTGAGYPQVVAGLATNQIITLGYSNGSFETEVTNTSATVSDMVTGDLNGDGRPDLLTSTGIFWGNGDGTFTQDITNLVFASPVAISDFNGDNIPDLFLGPQGIFLGTGRGTFSYQPGGPFAGSQVALGDFNNDGKADLAYSANTVPGLSVALGNGDGTFQTPQVLAPTV